MSEPHEPADVAETAADDLPLPRMHETTQGDDVSSNDERVQRYAEVIDDLTSPSIITDWAQWLEDVAEVVMAVADAEQEHDRLLHEQTAVRCALLEQALLEKDAEVERLKITPDNVETLLGIDPNDPLHKLASEIVRLRAKVAQVEALSNHGPVYQGATELDPYYVLLEDLRAALDGTR